MAADIAHIAHFINAQVPPGMDADGKDAVNFILSICKFSLMIWPYSLIVRHVKILQYLNHYVNLMSK
eukprot:2744942-Ditylum_brightwellii.AAC.1